MGKEQRGATGEKEQGRAREIGRERVGERPTEQETGANRRKGRWWVRADQGGFELTRVKGTPRRHEIVKK